MKSSYIVYRKIEKNGHNSFADVSKSESKCVEWI